MTRVAAALLLAAAFASAPAHAAPRILVMPFDNVARNTRIFWLSEAAAVVVADDLNALGADAMTREERREAFDRLQVPPEAMLTDATIIRIGEVVGAAEVVVGSIELVDDQLVVRARSIALESGRERSTQVERGPLADLFAIFERISRQIAPGSTRSTEDIERTHPPLPAFEDYIKGMLADSPSTATTYLNNALKIQPSFDRARLALWDVYNDEGQSAQALAAVAAVPAGSPVARRARFRAGLSLLQLKRYDDAFETFKALADAGPTAPILNDLGVVQVRRGASTTTGGRAVYYFTRASQLDPDDPDYCFNLGYAYWLDRDTQAAIYWLREAVRRNAADGDAHFVLGAALAAAGNGLEAGREKELAERLSSRYEEWSKRPSVDVPRGLERVKGDLDLPPARASAVVNASEQRNQQELAQFYLERGRRFFRQERDSEALVELNHALYLSPYEAEAHLLVGRIHLRAGRIREAIDAFKISLWSHESAEAHVALGQAYLANKQPDDARAEAQRALALDPGSADAKALLRKAEG